MVVEGVVVGLVVVAFVVVDFVDVVVGFVVVVGGRVGANVVEATTINLVHLSEHFVTKTQ